MSTYHFPPQLTSFIGRSQDMAAIRERIQDPYCRLLTILGSGGIGKTRMSVQVAHQESAQFLDGSLFVALQPLSSSADIIPKITNLLGWRLNDNAPYIDQLIGSLQDKQLLLVLDNFEHVIDGADLIAQLILGTTQVKIIVTSREALGLPMEWVHPLHGLAYPSSEEDHTDDTYTAIDLFADRARQASSHFDLEAEFEDIVHICQLVEGMPLALELAASWRSALSSADIAAEIDRSLNFLTARQNAINDRHRSIRAVFDHSWASLSDDEQAVFSQLSIFRGGFTLDAVRDITGTSILMISQLVDKSLVHLADHQRYDVHELLRKYAEEQLLSSSDGNALQQAHSRYYLSYVASLFDALHDHRQLDTLNAIDADLDNILIAWRYGCQQQDRTAIKDAIFTLLDFYGIRNRWEDIRHLLSYTLNFFSPEDEDKPDALWGILLLKHGRAISGFDVPQQSIDQVKRGLAIIAEHGTPFEHAISLIDAAYLLGRTQHEQDTPQYLQTAQDILNELGDYRFDANIILQHVMIAVGKNDQKAVIAYCEQGLPIAQKIGNLSTEGSLRSILAYATFGKLGDFVTAKQLLTTAFDIRKTLQGPSGIAMNTAHLGQFALYSGDLEEAEAYTKQSLDAGTAIGGWKHHLLRALITLGMLAVAKDSVQEIIQVWDQLKQADQQQDKNRFKYEWRVEAQFTSLAAMMTGNYEQAQTIIFETVTRMLHSEPPIFLTLLLVPAAMLRAHQEDAEFATELLGLAFSMEGSISKMMEHWSIVERLTANLQHRLGDARYDLHFQRGAARDLVTTARELQQHVGTPIQIDAIQQANATLLDPLTERELEVLNLIAQGMSNRQIAEQLVVSLGTVKKHNNNIFTKLHAESRLQAVEFARQAGLLA